MTIEATVGNRVGRLGPDRLAEDAWALRAAAPGTDRLKAIILGGRGGKRRLDAARSQPLALLEARDRPVLEWIAGALRSNRVDDLTYVGGYQLQKVMARYPELAYRFHAHWQDEGEVAAMAVGVADATRDHLIVRGDTVLRAEAIELLLAASGDVVAGSRMSASGDTVLTGSVLVRAARLPVVLTLAAELLRSDPMIGLDGLI